MSLDLLITPLDKFKIAPKLSQALKDTYHHFKFSRYGDKDKSLCMVNGTNILSISKILENQGACKNKKLQKKKEIYNNNTPVLQWVLLE